MEIQKEEEEDEYDEGTLMLFLDSMDRYINLLDSLSSDLRQGWLELASARHSMGWSRISSVLFDLKVKPASTTLQVAETINDANDLVPSVSEPRYTLSKWGSFKQEKCSSTDPDFGELKYSFGSELRHRGPSHPPETVEETHSTSSGSPVSADNTVQRERAKSLSIFGTLVSPKLRSAQVSFETALETIVEIANMRSLMLSTFSQLQKKRGISLKS